MPIAAYALPFGLRDVKLTPLGADGETPGTAVDLPASRTFSFSETEDFEEFTGDDAVLATHGSGPRLEWSLEGGGISVDALKVIAGGTVTQTGTTPNVKKTLAKKGTDTRPYFKVEGQVISDNGGDVHAIVWKCKADGDIGGEFSGGSFFLTGASGKGFATAADKLWDLVHNETAAVIT